MKKNQKCGSDSRGRDFLASVRPKIQILIPSKTLLPTTKKNPYKQQEYQLLNFKLKSTVSIWRKISPFLYIIITVPE
jgi:hypothetical protein